MLDKHEVTGSSPVWSTTFLFFVLFKKPGLCSARSRQQGADVVCTAPLWGRGCMCFARGSALTRALWCKGNIAQLVEHCLCKAGAEGSNPSISTLLFGLLVSAFAKVACISRVSYFVIQIHFEIQKRSDLFVRVRVAVRNSIF